jgi:yersiniabactin salicyl-AMP ligase
MFITEVDDTDDVIKSCQGRPIDDATEIRIVDENGNDVPEGEYGEVICRGPFTIDGYFEAPEANKTSFNEEGFYLTGDKAMRDKENRYRLAGRVKEQINRAGEKIMPSEVEELLCKNERIIDAAVVGIDDDMLGQKICACIIYKEGAAELKYKELIDFLSSEGLGSYKMPDEVRMMTEFPLTNMNKVNKVELKKMIENE